MDVANDVCVAGIEWRKYYISMINDQLFRILKQDKKMVVGRSGLIQFISTIC